MSFVLRADAMNLPLPDNSVDLIVTSPPYFALRSYRDGEEHYAGQIGSEPTPKDFLEALWAATGEMKRVLKPSGSIFVNLGDKYSGSWGNYGAREGKQRQRTEEGASWQRPGAPPQNLKPPSADPTIAGVRAKSLMGLPWRYAIGCIDQLDLILRAEIVWSKPNGLPESVTDRVRRSHEQWFHFVKEPRYFSAVDEIREAYTQSSLERMDAGNFLQSIKEHRPEKESYYGENRKDIAPNPLGKLPGSVWSIPSEPLIIPDWAKKKYQLPDHFAAFPQEWPRRIILGWSPSGICTECGEGRRPVSVPAGIAYERAIGNGAHGQAGKRPSATSTLGLAKNRSISGYSCACTEPSAPTTPSVVLDPFGGTGTVALVAKALGRTGISVDLSRDYCRLAEWRINESGHGKKAEQRTWAERQMGLAI